jgi:hypothetical protein
MQRPTQSAIVDQEFRTVDILLPSDTTTGRTDAFIIAWVKCEKQVRKIFTYLVYQLPAFSSKDRQSIIDTIAANNGLYLDNFIIGFNHLYPTSFQAIVGADYSRLKAELVDIKKYRNKILHGQPTGANLSPKQLTAYTKTMREWCSVVTAAMLPELGFGGFERNSFRKNTSKDLSSTYRHSITDIASLKDFMKKHMKEPTKLPHAP